jgi:aminomethyltransferase
VTDPNPIDSASTERPATELPPRFSPLHAIHVAGGASFTDFAGWQMPVSYGSDLAEHHAVRTAAGIFDISHMAEIRVAGTDAGAFLDYALAGKLSVIAPLQAKYTLLLAEDGGIVDDLIVYSRGENEYLVVANAGNRFAAVAALTQRAADFAENRLAAGTATPDRQSPDLEITDLSDDISLIAVQGPASRAILEATTSLSIDAGQPALADLKYYWSTNATFAGGPVFIGRTGYTGEDGFELYVNVADAAALWNALIEAGAPIGLISAGLASRDTLRLEAGMPLYGHELSLDTFPVQAGLGKVVALGKEGDFVGRAAVEAGPPAAASAPITADEPAGARVLIGLTTGGKRAGRADYPIFWGDTEVGIITSGALSPTLGYPIAMAYVDPEAAAAGAEAPGALSVDVRGTRIPATVVPLPFYKRDKN